MRRSEMSALPDTCTPDQIGLLSDQEGVPVGEPGASDGTMVTATRLLSPENISVQGE
jgi:hypothetical protein